MNYIKLFFLTINIFLGHLASAQNQDTVMLYKNFSVVFPCSPMDDRMIHPEYSCKAEGEFYVASADDYNDGVFEEVCIWKVEDIGGRFGDYTITSQKYITGFGRQCYYAEVNAFSYPAAPYFTILIIPSGNDIAVFYTFSAKKYSEGSKKFFDSITVPE